MWLKMDFQRAGTSPGMTGATARFSRNLLHRSSRIACFAYSEGAMAKLPPKNRIPVMMSDEELAAVDAWRVANGIATRSDAIRRLCQMGLQSNDPDAAQDTGS
jgi:hypothetical protein